MYIAAAEDVSPEVKVADWWKNHETEIPACKHVNWSYLFSHPLHLRVSILHLAKLNSSAALLSWRLLSCMLQY